MKKHTKVYLDYFGLDASDFLSCEICWAPGIDSTTLTAEKWEARKVRTLLKILCYFVGLATKNTEIENSLKYFYKPFITKN
jgi:hypothetical protein